MDCKIHKAIGPLDRHEGPRLHGNRNQQRSLCSAPACAPHALVPCAHARTSGPGPHRLGPFILSWSISIDSHKAKQREVTSDLCLNQLQIPLTLALKRGLRHPPSLGTQRNIHKDIYRRCEWNTSVTNKTIYILIWKVIKKLHTE